MPLPDKIQCPYSRQELAELCETHSSSQLVDYILKDKGLAISRSLVLKWLRAYKIPRRRYSPFVAHRVECPYTSEKLHDLYWKQGMPCRKIAESAEQVLGRAVSDAIVQRWLRETGITLRTPHEWLVLRSKSDPERWREHARKYLAPADKFVGNSSRSGRSARVSVRPLRPRAGSGRPGSAPTAALK